MYQSLFSAGQRISPPFSSLDLLPFNRFARSAPAPRRSGSAYLASIRGILTRLALPAALACCLLVGKDSASPLPTASAPNLFGSVALPAGRPASQMLLLRTLAKGLPTTSGPWNGVIQRARSLDEPARLEAVNAYVNHAISYATDEQVYGVQKHWAAASESLPRGRGDCVGYAIAKLQILAAAGVPQRDLYFVVVNDLVRREEHALVAVQSQGRFFILDSGADRVLPAEEVRDYRPVITLSFGNAWVHGYRQGGATLASSSSQPTDLE